MKIDVTYGQVNRLVTSLSEVGDMDLPAIIAFRFGKLMARLQDDYDMYQKHRRELVTRHAVKSADGSPALPADDGSVELDTPIEFRQELRGIEREVACDLHDLSWKDLGGIWANGQQPKASLLLGLYPILSGVPALDGKPVELRNNELSMILGGLASLSELPLPSEWAIQVVGRLSLVVAALEEFGARRDLLLAEHAQRDSAGKVVITAGAIQLRDAEQFAAENDELLGAAACVVPALDASALLGALEDCKIEVKPRVLAQLESILSDDEPSADDKADG